MIEIVNLFGSLSKTKRKKPAAKQSSQQLFLAPINFLHRKKSSHPKEKPNSVGFLSSKTNQLLLLSRSFLPFFKYMPLCSSYPCFLSCEKNKRNLPSIFNPNSQPKEGIMASLVLLLSELLRHENVDQLIALPVSSSTSCAAQAATTATAAPRVAENSSQSNKKLDREEDDLPCRVCVDLIWT